jgi:hypothetical protein
MTKTLATAAAAATAATAAAAVKARPHLAKKNFVRKKQKVL